MVLVAIYDRESLLISVPVCFGLKFLQDSIIRYFQTLDNGYFTHDLGLKRDNIYRRPHRKRTFGKQTAGKASEKTRTWGRTCSITT
jgi:hypothetical protein